MFNPERITYFAATDTRGRRVPFGIKAKDRSKHVYVIGKTGMGKSTMLENMAIQDIQNGEGLAFVDPHGASAENLLKYVPEHRVKDVVYFAPFDMEQPIAFNVMEDVGYDKRHLVVSGLMSTFKKIWVDAWSARMEYILSNTLLALLEYPDATLLGVNRMYVDKEYRKKVVENIKDPVVKDFWTKEFATYTDRYTQEATPAIQNKIGQFTSNPLIRNIVGQPKSSFDIRQMMDERKILIVNLSKGLVGDVNQRLLGSMITTRIYLAAMSRADAGEGVKKLAPFYFYVDEFQNFANETFAEVLSEARKYNLCLTIAHQYIAQMEEEVRDAVFGNVGTTIIFRVGPLDAEAIEPVFAPRFEAEDIVNLGIYQIYLTLMIDGVGSPPFSAVTIPPIKPPLRTFEREVVNASRITYGGARQGVEAAVFADLASTAQALADAGAAAAAAKKGSKGPPWPKRDGPRQDLPPRPSRPDAPRPEKPREREPLLPEVSLGDNKDLRDILKKLSSEETAKRSEKPREEKTALKEAVAAAAPRQEAPREPRREQKPPQHPPKHERQQGVREERRDDRPAPHHVPEEVLRNIIHGS